LLQQGDIRDLKGVKLCAIGPSTAQRIARFGVRADLVPDESRAEGVFDALQAAGPLSGTRVLLPRADIAREVLPEQLREAGADVTEVVAYRTIVAGGERDSDQDIYRMLLDRQIDAVTFTSASTVRNFARMLGEEQAADLLNTTVVAAIGPVTAEAAQQLGINVAVIPKKYTIPDLVDALVEHFASEEAAAT
jgi:uroporphyrinogen III methyltransferase/synthase